MVRVIVLDFDRAIVRGLLIPFAGTDACEVSLVATLEAFARFAMLFFFPVVSGLAHRCRGVHGILVTRGKAGMRWLEVASSLALLGPSLFLGLLRASPVEVVKWIVLPLSLVQTR